MYADDTAALCSGADIQTAKRRAQLAADSLVEWARSSKMVVAGPKTQVMVLSQWARDAVDLSIKVAGVTVKARDTLNLLGVTLDRLLHFGQHCKKLKQRTRPRLAHLRRLTGRDWGLEEKQLRTVANGYVRGALEHAAEAWLPSTPPSHVEVLEREMRAAARIITGCVASTPTHALMAEAGLAPVASRRTTLAARLLAKARALPEEDPLRRVADSTAAKRLTTVTGWREVGQVAWTEAGVEARMEPILQPRTPPWLRPAPVTFDLEAGTRPPPGSPADRRRQEAALCLASLPQCATWVWTDGSAEEGFRDGGAGALIVWPDDSTEELRAPAGSLCSSYRAEMVALRTALRHLLEHPAHEDVPIVICTDSQAALAALRSGPSEQRTQLNSEVWDALTLLTREGARRLHLQWVPSHCGLEGNERADVLAKEASALPQEEVPLDVRTVLRASARAARAKIGRQRPSGWYRDLWGERLPPPAADLDRHAAVEVHQLRAGHWSGSAQYMHRIGRNPTVECPGCNDHGCRAGRCPVCREEADTPGHVLLRCPALMNLRFRLLGTIHPSHEEIRSADVVAALAAATRRLQSREASRQ
ncbi:uncharacterized protein LOC122372368 [Amphibalanus amphitrite]|uniref:uncharacterized protein LOC122372368 n=1 Tax=Amphibalanus amphitrite TaxID=1232801 RepID=UPI001C922720|nr:uncharacterized protein LOC122372368 [Amphibalanus amphitrite]